jgi:hypothetical protein
MGIQKDEAMEDHSHETDHFITTSISAFAKHAQQLLGGYLFTAQ